MNSFGKKFYLLWRGAFHSVFDIVITLCFLAFVVFSSIVIFQWLVFNADWTVVTQNLSLYSFGTFPSDLLWRPALWLFLFFSLVSITLLGTKSKSSFTRKTLPITWIFIVPLGVYILSGGIGLSPIASRFWGGLTLTILLTSCSAFLAFPLGMLLALGRQSDYLVIRYLSAIYVDAIRSVPLIAILFFGQLLIPLFLPFGLEINRVVRAIIAFTLFVSAYIAEDIRGGLQAVPKSQVESAKSIGLNDFQIKRFIILPQALKIALPALANQAIGLLQNTSLMAILGLVELLGISRSILANPQFIGRYLEVYVWLALIYWFMCTMMALLARHLEKRMTIQKSNS